MEIPAEVTQLLDWLEALPLIGQIGVAIGASLVFLALIKYYLFKKLSIFVNETEIGWDNDLYNALEPRTMFFTVAICINASLAWVAPEFLDTIFPFLNAVFILLFTSMMSSSIKVVTPPFMTWINSNNQGVSVTGGNHFISIFARMIVWFVGIYLVLTELEIELTGIAASFALFSLIIGFSLQHTIGNILNSFMLAMDSPFDVGDRIEVDGTEGRVVSTGILSTKLLTYSEELVVIPNNTLVQSKIRNMARGGGDGEPRRINLLIDVGAAYGEQPPHVKQVLIDIAKECPYTVEEPAPRVLMNDLGEYSIDFRIFAWIDNYADQWPARDWILQRVFERFEEEGIEIPFPTSIELPELPTKGSDAAKKRKRARQKAARIQMSKDEKYYLEERDTLKAYVEDLEKQASDTSLSSREKDRIRAEISSLSQTLERFDADD